MLIGDVDVAVGANVGDEELQQRGLDASAQVDVEPLRAGDLGEAGDGEDASRCGCSANESNSMRPLRSVTRSGSGAVNS